jgi:predicted Zn-dependent protease
MQKPVAQHNPELMEYVEQFKLDAWERGCLLDSVDLRRVKRIPEDYSEYGVAMSTTDAGLCVEQTVIEYQMPYTGISTNKMSWSEIWIRDNVVEEEELRSLMYHELGHCYMGLDHKPNDPNHLMYPTSLYSEKDWIERVDQLFEGCKTIEEKQKEIQNEVAI